SVATLLVASDVRGLASAPALTSNFRTESWVVPLTPRDVRVWQARALLDREARAQSLLETLKPNLRLTGPDDALLSGLQKGRGGAGADTLAGSNGPVTLLLLFPGLLSLAAAILAARALTPCLRLAERGARRSRTSVRLAVLALARSTARTAVAVGFLVVSIGLSLLAVGYRTTLERGVDDEAAYQVPL